LRKIDLRVKNYRCVKKNAPRPPKKAKPEETEPLKPARKKRTVKKDEAGSA
jgi:hypothetical protein